MYGLPAAGGEGGGVGDIPASLEDIMASAGVAHAGSEDATAGTDIEGTYEYGYMRAPNRARGGHRTDYGIGSYYGAGLDGMEGEGGFNSSEYVMVDAHVLASPTLADINGDGHMEVSRTVYLLEILVIYYY